MIKKRRRILVLSKFHHQEEMEGVAQYARKAGWALRFVTCTETTIPQDWPYDGIILIHSYYDDAMLDFIEGSTVPSVLIDRNPWPNKDIPRVSYDLEAAFLMGINYFMSHSYQNIALIDYKEHDPAFKRITTMIKESGRNFVPIRKKNLKEDLAKAPKPLALMAPDDHWSMSIYLACEEIGLQVPEQVALLGTSNTRHLCEFNVIPLSSVDTQVSLSAYRAAEKLELLLDGQEVSNIEFLPPKEIIVRESTAVPAIADHRVAKAYKLILRNFRQNIIFDELAKDCGLNRWSLDLLFKKEFGTTMNTQLYELRMAEAQRLLQETDLAIQEIAKAVSYENHVSFLRAFQKKFQCNPSTLRKNSAY